MGIIRTLLAIAVCIFHSYHIFGWRMTDGEVSVQAFYMISGFYMAMILAEKYTGPGSYRLFITNRLLRLYPLYFIVLLLALAVSLFSWQVFGNSLYLWAWLGYGDRLHWTTILVFVLVNLFLLGSDWLQFMCIDRNSGMLYWNNGLRCKPATDNFMLVPQAWSVGLEMAFYFVAPFLSRLRWQVLLSLIVLLLALRIWCTGHVLYIDPWTYRFFPLEMAIFLAGMLAYKMYAYLRTRPWNSILLNGAWFGIIFLITVFYFIPVNFLVKEWTFYVLLFAALPFIFIRTKNLRFDRWIGELSYPFYIVHHLVLICIKPYIWHGRWEYLKYFGLASVIISLLLAILLNKWIAAPIERYRQKRALAAA